MNKNNPKRVDSALIRRCSIVLLFVLLVIAIHPVGGSAAESRYSVEDICPFNPGFGETIHCSIDVAGETDAFTFSGSAGDRIRASVVETSGSVNPFLEIVRPDGTSLCGTVVGELTCLLDSTGLHTLLVKDFSGPNTGNYSLYLQRLSNPVACSAASFGALPISGIIDVPALHHCLTFTLTTGDRVRGRVVETAGTLTAFLEIVRPDGTTLCSGVVGEVTCLADITGPHTLLIRDFGGTHLGNYNFYIQRVNNPVGCSAIAFTGVPTSGVINSAAETHCFTFSALDGKNIRVRVVETSGNLNPFIEVLRPNGTTLCETIVGEITCELDMSGTHTILIDDFVGTRLGEYQLTLLCLTQPCSGPLPSHFLYLPVMFSSE